MNKGSISLALGAGGLAAVLTTLFPLGILGFAALCLLAGFVFTHIRLAVLLFIVTSAWTAALSPLFTYRFAAFHFSHLITILLSLIFFWGVRENPKGKFIQTHLDYPLSLFFLAALLSVLNSYVFWDFTVPLTHRHLIVQFTGLVLILFSIFTFLVVSRYMDSERWINRAYFSLIGTACFLAFFSLPNRFLHLKLVPTPLAQIDFGIVYTLGLALAFSSLLYASKLIHKLGWFAACGVITFAVWSFFMSGSRTYLAVAASVLFITFMRSRKLFIGLLIASIVLAIVYPSPFQNLLGLKSSSWHYRLILWKDTFQVLDRHWSFWLWGVGPGNYYAYSLVYTFNAAGAGTWGLTTPHNQYLVILGEVGLVGFSLFFWVVINILKTGFSLVRSARSPVSKSFSVGALGGFVGILVISIFADSLLPSISNLGFNTICTSLYSWILLGLLYAQVRKKEDRP